MTASIVKVAVALGLIATASVALADVPDVPEGDIFGFTTPSDVGEVGEKSFVNEIDGRGGKRQGVYRAINSKYELGYTFKPEWWAGASLLWAYNRMRDVPGYDDINRMRFQGASFEIERRLIKRSETNPFAVSFSIEPRVTVVDQDSGQTARAAGVELLFTDAVLVPDKLFIGSNIVYELERGQEPKDGGRWASSSTLHVSAALAYQLSQRMFVGLEIRLLTAFDSAFLDDHSGSALFLGPTLLEDH